MLIMMAAFVASRATGLARDVVFGHQFGTSPAYAAFLAANQIPDLLFQVLAGGAVASAFIPVFAGLLAARQEAEAWRLVSALFTVAALVMLPIVAALWLAAPLVVGLLAPGFGPELRALAADLTRVMLPAPLLFTWGCLATSVLQTYHRFLLPALAPTVYNLALIGGALAAGFLPPDERRVFALAGGALVGSVLFLAVQVPGLVAQRARLRPLLALGSPALRQVGLLMLPRALGLAVAQLNLLVALYFASGMPERYAALMYAYRLMMLPLGVFGMALGTAVFPTLAAQAAQGTQEALRTTLAGTLRVVLFLTLPAALGLMLLGEPIVRALFERGDFRPDATAATAAALSFYALALVAQAAVEILTRGFYALRDTRTPVAVAVVAMGVNVVASALLVVDLGHRGLALALALASACEAALLLGLLRRRLGGLALRALGGTLWRAAA
ncbi:MAG: murein biosynthesis integral membrane protein MurJ, partial [Chloroflexi bacterium]|nr:murein biosynthesis integral membrane protein MurJ [Chloroflexota bacterium]